MPTRPLPLQETACPCISHLTLLDRSERKYSASFFLSDNVQNKKASRGKTLYLQTTGTCFVKIYSVCKRLCLLVHVVCRMASLLCTWQPRRITWRWCGSFWRTAPARVSPLRYCTCVCVCVSCAHMCVHFSVVCIRAFSMPLSYLRFFYLLY